MSEIYILIVIWLTSGAVGTWLAFKEFYSPLKYKHLLQIFFGSFLGLIIFVVGGLDAISRTKVLDKEVFKKRK